MSFPDDCRLLSLIKNQDNEEAKSAIKNVDLFNAVDSQKNTLLHYAAEYKNPEVVQFLIESGSEIDAKNDLGETPLIKSMKTHLPCAKVIDILLGAGADVELEDFTDKSASNIVDSCEWLTVDARRFEILKVFIERTDRLFSAVKKLHKDFIQTLLETNVNLNRAKGETLVHMLARNAQPGVIEQLRGRNYDVNARNEFGWTPLMLAAVNENVEATKFLLDEGADVEATTYDKETALYLTIYYGAVNYINKATKEIVQILLHHGANAQILISDDDVEFDETVFKWLQAYSEDEVPELILAHLALQEARGTAITDLIRSRINASPDFEAYLKDCQQKLSIEIHPSVTLFDLLTAGQRKMERYFRDEQLASKLADFETEIEYFDTILSQSFAKASGMVKLRKKAVPIVCNLIKINHDRFSSIADEIVDYLDEKNIVCLILIQVMNDYSYICSKSSELCNVFSS